MKAALVLIVLFEVHLNGYQNLCRACLKARFLECSTGPSEGGKMLPDVNCDKKDL